MGDLGQVSISSTVSHIWANSKRTAMPIYLSTAPGREISSGPQKPLSRGIITPCTSQAGPALSMWTSLSAVCSPYISDTHWAE